MLPVGMPHANAKTSERQGYVSDCHFRYARPCNPHLLELVGNVLEVLDDAILVFRLMLVNSGVASTALQVTANPKRMS